MSGLEGKKVLIVDDSEYIREKLKIIFKKEGMSIAGEAENGIRAIEQYQKLKPDIVTLDIIMPKMQGIKALQKIKHIDPDAVVVMISSIGSEDKVKEAIDNGAKNFILKPFNEQTVISVIERVIK